MSIHRHGRSEGAPTKLRARGLRGTAVLGGVLALLGALVLAPAGSAAASSTYTLTTIYPVSDPTSVAYDPATNDVFVANKSGNALTVIDASTDRVVQTLALPQNGSPTDLAFDSASKAILVADAGVNEILEVSGSPAAITRTVSLPTGTDPQAVTFDGPSDTIDVAAHSGNVVLLGSGSTTNLSIPAAAPGAQSIVADQQTGQVFLAAASSATVTEFFEALQPTSVSLSAKGATTVSALAVDSSTDTVYAATNIGVVPISGSTLQPGARIGNPASAVALDRSTNTIYAAQASTLTVIDGATDQVTAIVGLSSGATAKAAVFDASSDTVYTADGFPSDTVSAVAISTATTAGDSDLALSREVNISVVATSSHGAAVTFPAPTVTDEDATTPSAACTPFSGATFPIGTTRVTCSVSDMDDRPASATTSFTVTVLAQTPPSAPSPSAPSTATSAFATLAGAAQGVGPGRSLAAKVSAAERAWSSGHLRASCAILGAFVHELRAQTGRHVPSSAASVLMADVHQLETALSC